MPEAPQQVARDGEDYAVMATSVVASLPFKLYIHCQGTVDCFAEPISISTGSGNSRAHLWT
eukprot:871927-Heterocapsa_arctica.AAC.1